MALTLSTNDCVFQIAVVQAVDQNFRRTQWDPTHGLVNMGFHIKDVGISVSFICFDDDSKDIVLASRLKKCAEARATLEKPSQDIDWGQMVTQTESGSLQKEDRKTDLIAKNTK